MERGLQVGRTRWAHDQMGYHLVWRPKSRRKVLTAGAAAATKDLVAEASLRNGLTLIAVETDIAHVHASSPLLRDGPSQIANLLKG